MATGADVRGRAHDGRNGSAGVRGNGVSRESAGEAAEVSSGGNDRRDSEQLEKTDMMIKRKIRQ